MNVFVRLMSQLSDGYVQSSVGKFTFLTSHIGLVVYFLLGYCIVCILLFFSETHVFICTV